MPSIPRRLEMAMGRASFGSGILARHSDLTRLSVAIVHRGFVAATTLLLTIFAGRTLPPEQFGAYAILMGIVPLVLVGHSSFFTEPMLVFGGVYADGAARNYRGMVLRWQVGFGLVCSAVLLLSAVLLPSLSHVSSGILVLAAIIPLLLSIEFEERYALMRLRPDLAARSAGLQFVGAVLAIVVLSTLNLVSLPSLIAVAGVITLLPGAMLYLAFERSEPQADARPPPGDVWRQSFSFGRVALVAQLLTYLVVNAYIFIIPLVADVADAGVLRAQSVITGPAVQAYSALGVLAIPILRAVETREDFLRKSRFLMAVIMISGLGFWLLVGACGAWLVSIVFAGSYSLPAEFYWLIGAYPMVLGLVFLTGSIVRSLERPAIVVAAAAASVLLTLLPGIWLVAEHGAIGAILAQTIGAAVMLVAALIMLPKALAPTTR